MRHLCRLAPQPLQSKNSMYADRWLGHRLNGKAARACLSDGLVGAECGDRGKGLEPFHARSQSSPLVNAAAINFVRVRCHLIAQHDKI